MYFNPCHDQPLLGPRMMTSPRQLIPPPGHSEPPEPGPSTVQLLTEEEILSMAKDVLKVHACRWNAKDSSHVRDSRTDCGAHLACFANLEKVCQPPFFPESRTILTLAILYSISLIMQGMHTIRIWLVILSIWTKPLLIVLSNRTAGSATLPTAQAISTLNLRTI